MTVRSSIAAFWIGTSSSSRSCGQHEAADMLREMARKADQGRPTARAPGPAADRVASRPASPTCLRFDAAAAAAPDRVGHHAQRVGRQAERLADVADGAAAAIGDHGGGERGAGAALGPVDPLDDLLAPLVLEIDVDVGRLVALVGQEALEQDLVLVGIDLGDAEAVADGGVGGRSATLAKDAHLARLLDDLVHRQEVGRDLLAARSGRTPCAGSSTTFSGMPSG